MLLPLRYDTTGLIATLPDDLDCDVLHLNPLPPLPDAHGAIRDSLSSLEALARGRESACIVLCDVTRPVPNEAILTPTLQCLHDCGVSEDNITLLVATGLHRPSSDSELEQMIGARLAHKYRVVNHRAREAGEQRSIGRVAVGARGDDVEVALDRAYLDADLKITTGLIEPHFMAGYSGGRKMVCPGIASAETILAFHSPPMIAHPNARTGILEGNPIHQMSLDVARRAGMDWMCNVTLSEDRQITGVFAGDLEDAHARGASHVEMQSKVRCEPGDIVLTTGAGYPLDATFYQCIKGMVAALPALKPGGSLIICGAMREGVGGHEFAQMCRSITTPDEFLARIFHSPVEIDQWQLQEMMLALAHCGEIFVVTPGVDADFLRGCGLIPMSSVDEAMQAALSMQGPNARVVCIPEGPYVTPVAATSLRNF